ncbi:MAG TPA: cyclase family protein [Pyrinomonadaceae bacterium]|jgi:kynurenine formamidase
MLISIEFDNQSFEVDASNPLNIAVPLRFGGAQPNAYGVEPATSRPCEAGALVGDTRRGGSCNFEQYKFIPHCNGTHTESIGHITHERISVQDCLKDAFMPAALISIAPENAANSSETYPVALNEKDWLLTRRAIERAISNFRFQISDFKSKDFPKALVVRTLPNDEGKLTKTYLDKVPPFFSTEAMLFMREIGVRHLLVDLPSIDRIFDEGKLSNHRIFWQVEQGAFETSPESLLDNTITELIYVGNDVSDGEYLLNLQIAPFAADASPSRPLLFALR